MSTKAPSRQNIMQAVLNLLAVRHRMVLTVGVLRQTASDTYVYDCLAVAAMEDDFFNLIPARQYLYDLGMATCPRVIKFKGEYHHALQWMMHADAPKAVFKKATK